MSNNKRNAKLEEKKQNQLALWRHRQSDAKWRSEVQSLYLSLRKMLKESGRKQTRACLLSDVEDHIKLLEDQVRRLSSANGIATQDEFKEEFLEILKQEEAVWQKEKKERKKEGREQQKKLEATLKVIHPKLGKGNFKLLPPPKHPQNKENFYLSLPKDSPRPDASNYIYLEIINASNSNQTNSSKNSGGRVLESHTKGIFVPFLKVNGKEPVKNSKKVADSLKTPVPFKKFTVLRAKNQLVNAAGGKRKRGNGQTRIIGNMPAVQTVKQPNRRRKTQHPQKCLPLQNDDPTTASDCSTDDLSYDWKPNSHSTMSKRRPFLIKPPSHHVSMFTPEKEPQLPVLEDVMLTSSTCPMENGDEIIEEGLEFSPSEFFANLETLPNCQKDMDYECETSVYNLLQDIMSEKECVQ